MVISDVTVSDCNIYVGDDGITLRAAGEGSYYGFRNKANICERVTVTNCVIHSHRANGIRIGVGSGIICNCILTSLDVEAPNYAGIEINSKWHRTAKQITTVENIIFSDMHIRARKAFDIVSAYGEEPIEEDCYIKRLLFKNIMLTQREHSKLYSRPDAPVEGVVFTDVYDLSQSVSQVFDIQGEPQAEINIKRL